MEQSPQASTKRFLEGSSVKDFSNTCKRKIEENDTTGRKKIKTQHCPTPDVPVKSDTSPENHEVNKVGVVIVDHDERIAYYPRQSLSSSL